MNDASMQTTKQSSSIIIDEIVRNVLLFSVSAIMGFGVYFFIH
jgi:hypothetical protein